MNEWHLKYNMDGMQWDVTEIHLYEPSMPCVYFDGSYPKMSYAECIKLIWFDLFPCVHQRIPVHLHCIEATYLLNKSDIKWIMKQLYPEELI